MARQKSKSMTRHSDVPGARTRIAGFTLIEVLVAVAIVALGLSGILATINGMVGSSAYLRDKTLANWVAQNHITELRLQPEWPDLGKSTDEAEMAGQAWHIETEVIETPVEKLRRINVSVSFEDSKDSPLVTVAAFVGQSFGLTPRPDWRAGISGVDGRFGTDGDDDSADEKDQKDGTRNPDSDGDES